MQQFEGRLVSISRNNNDISDCIERRNLRFSQSLDYAVNGLQYAQVARAQLCANHVLHMESL